MNEDDTSNLNIYCDSKNKLVDDSDNETYIFMDKSCRCYIIGLAQISASSVCPIAISQLSLHYVHTEASTVIKLYSCNGNFYRRKGVTYIRLEIK